jgi:small-conductance mechanosensitive channel
MNRSTLMTLLVSAIFWKDKTWNGYTRFELLMEVYIFPNSDVIKKPVYNYTEEWVFGSILL